jgi:hypothetical protein
MENLGFFKSSVDKPLLMRIYYTPERKIEKLDPRYGG